MRAGFEYYRAIPENEIQNQNYSKTNLTMPTLGLGGGYTPAFGGNVTMLSVCIRIEVISRECTECCSSKFRALDSGRTAPVFG